MATTSKPLCIGVNGEEIYGEAIRVSPGGRELAGYYGSKQSLLNAATEYFGPKGQARKEGCTSKQALSVMRQIRERLALFTTFPDKPRPVPAAGEATA
jgi:hypothetical protein